MRKRLITLIPQAGTHLDEGWLDLDREAVVEVTSEEKEYRWRRRWSQEKRGTGVPLILALKPSD